MNPWVEYFLEVEEMREYQKMFFKSKGGSRDRKLIMAKSKLCEMKVDQLGGKLRKMAEEKGINLTKPQEDEPEQND